MNIYNNVHSIRQNFPTLQDCFNYYYKLHEEYISLVDEIRTSYFNKENGNYFAEKCLTFYTISKDDMSISYADVYLFWNLMPLECDCIKLCLLLIPVILFQKVLFYKLTDTDKKYKSFLKFRDTLKDIYEIVLKGDKHPDKCPYMNTVMANMVTKLKRLDTTIQSVHDAAHKNLHS